MSLANRCTRWAAVSFLACAAFGKPAPQACGTSPYQHVEELAMHRTHSRQLRVKAKSALAVRDASRDVGDIYVLEDTEGIASRRNPFNLNQKSLVFQPDEGQYRYRVAAVEFDQNAADAGAPIAGLDDDDTREQSLPFEFPFFGMTYTVMHVNSDGNITFEESDGLTAERTLGRTIGGPPRIAGFYTDLDPTRASASVRVFREDSRVVVTWANVPEYSDFGGAPRNTFQIVLSSDGTIGFAYSNMASRSAVVGVAPGRGSQVTAAEFATALEGAGPGAVVENFAAVESLDLALAAQNVIRNHGDNYDFIAFFNNMGVEARTGAVALQVSVRSAVQGIGDSARDDGAIFGSAQRLQGTMNMGPLSQYPQDPNGIVSRRFGSGDTPLSILGHEFGHQWLAFVSTREGSSQPMLANNLVHWNFLFNSEASLLEGNRIRDNGEGASPRFTTVATVEGYSALDQYLMGLRGPSEVPPTFYVTSANISGGSRLPQVGISFDGTRRDVTIDELIERHGPRVPDHTVAQRKFRMAFVLIVHPLIGATTRELDQIERLRQAFEPYFEKVTEGRASIDTRLGPAANVSAAPSVESRTAR